MTAPSVIAHRGYAGVAPENTVRAAETAAADPDTEMVEVDVRPAADGTPVVFHDDRLDGVREGRPITDAAGLVRETPLAALREARVLGTGSSVPTLADALAAVPASVGVNVELKGAGTADRRPGESLPEAERADRRALWTPFVERVVDDCDEFGGAVLLSSFCEGALAAARDVASDYPAAALAGDDLAAGLAVARRYDCEAIHPPRNVIAGTVLASTAYAGRPAGEPSVDVLAAARGEGRAVNVWTVETWVQFADLAAAGVDGVIADYPGLGRAAAGD